MTLVFKGICASQGLAEGRIHVVADQTPTGDTIPSDPVAERERLRHAFDDVERQIASDSQTARSRGENEMADVFEAHVIMLTDPDFRDEALDKVDAETGAVGAVLTVAEGLASVFTAASSDYLQARVADLNDIRNRLLDALAGRERRNLAHGPDVILLADDFTPSMTAGLTAANCGGLIMIGGSYTSHASIFARNQGIPAVTKCQIDDPKTLAERLALLNASTGELTVDPDDESREQFRVEQASLTATRNAAEQVRGLQVLGPSGPIALLANVGSLEDVAAAIELDAEGVGLFRTETIYLSGSQVPAEDEQYKTYSKAAALLSSRRLIIRTLDIGADKQLDYLNQVPEPNPALGVRGIRLCLRHPELFLPQLRAILRTCASHDNVWVMLPMVTSPLEITQFRSLVDQQLAELTATGIKAAPPASLGVMIETPAAVIQLQEIIQLVDFISIGTNDLVQYYYAIDRESPIFTDIVHDNTATMELLSHIIATARSAGVHVGVCGELAADPQLASELVALGVDDLSMSPPRILSTRLHLIHSRGHDTTQSTQQLTRK